MIGKLASALTGWPSLATIALMHSGVAAEEGTLAVASSDAATAAQAVPLEAAYSPIALERPVGRVFVAQVGDELGERRFASREGGSGPVTVTFARSAPRNAGTSRSQASMPTGLPLQRGILTSGFGYRVHPISGRNRHHSGIDIAAPAGTPILATSDGTVIAAGWMGGYGIAVRLDHGGSVETRYAHMSRLAVSANQRVVRGQVIGFVGSTGRSTGPHLHYEIRTATGAIDPMR